MNNLNFSKENGYKITVIKGYNFNTESNVFTDYINSVYSIKANAKNTTQKSMAKSLLNNLLGRFGINLDKSITEIMSEETFERKSLMNLIVSYKEIGNGKYLVTYVPKLDYDIIKSHNLDFLKVLKKYKDNEIRNINNTSTVISAAVTAYARIYISKIKLYILSKGGNIFYWDTYSIVTNIKLSDNLVSSKEIGKLKLEHKVKKGIFITNKTYCLIDDKDKFINCAKGIKSWTLEYIHYV